MYCCTPAMLALSFPAGLGWYRGLAQDLPSLRGKLESRKEALEEELQGIQACLTPEGPCMSASGRLNIS